MITTRGGQLGFVEPLGTLGALFANPEICRKLQLMCETYSGYRPCRGDGNCFYRALGFAYVERERTAGLTALLQKLDDGKTKSLPCAAGEVCDAVKHLKSKAEVYTDMGSFYVDFLTDASLDKSLVWVVRGLCAQYCLENRESSAVGSDLGTLQFFLCEVLGHPSVESFLQSEVLQDGVEAMDAVQLIAPHALDCRVRLVQLDGTVSSQEGPAVHEFPAERKTATGEGDAARDPLCLLFKPGHYDILYIRAYANDLFQQQSRGGLEKRCRVPWTCCICLSAEDEAAVCKPWLCVHGICEDCGAGQDLALCLACKAGPEIVSV